MGSNQSMDIAMDTLAGAMAATEPAAESIKWYKAFWKKRTLLLILIPVSLLILWIVRNNPMIAEFVFA